LADNEGFARRWSERKAAARRQSRKDDAPSAAPEPEAADAAAPASESPTPTPTSAPVDPETLPDPETLTADSDFAPFLRDGVPEELQRVALRRLWRLDPVLANLDGLVDYGEDFTDAATVIQGMQSVYQVGRGMTTAFQTPESEAESEAEAGDQAPAVETEETEPDGDPAIAQETPATSAAPAEDGGVEGTSATSDAGPGDKSKSA
jgi:hypothetical protein